MVGLHSHKKLGYINDDQWRPIIHIIDEKRADCLKYVEKTFEDNGWNALCNLKCNTGPPISIGRVRTVFKGVRDGKTEGSDDFYAEFLEILNDTGIKC